MTHTLTTSKGTFLFVGAEKIISDQLQEYILERLPERVKVISRLSTLTEDHAREVVDEWDNSSWICGSTPYMDYINPPEPLDKAIDSIRSLMQAERLYTEVKKKPNVMDYDSYGDKHNATFRKHLSEWHTAQPRTFPDWLIIKVK